MQRFDIAESIIIIYANQMEYPYWSNRDGKTALRTFPD